MNVISEANESILSILKRFLNKEKCVRWSQYCIQLHVDEGVLVSNLLTRETILLSKEEHEDFLNKADDRFCDIYFSENIKCKEYRSFCANVFNDTI